MTSGSLPGRRLTSQFPFTLLSPRRESHTLTVTLQWKIPSLISWLQMFVSFVWAHVNVMTVRVPVDVCKCVCRCVSVYVRLELNNKFLSPTPYTLLFNLNMFSVTSMYE